MGGEPLLYENLDKTFDIFSDTPITIQTNAMLVREKLKILKKAKEVICSVDGGCGMTEMIRGPGVFEKVLDGIKLLKDSGVEVLLRSSLFPEMLPDVPSLIEIAKNLNIGVYFFPLLGKRALNLDEQYWLFKQLEMYEKSWVDLPSYFSFYGKKSYCAAGESRLAFWTDRTVKVCQFFDFTLGLIDDDFEDIRNNAEIFVKTFKRIPEECFACEMSEFCKGGCLLTPYYKGCPNRPRVKKHLERERWNYKKPETIKMLLRGVVTCAIALFALTLGIL